MRRPSRSRGATSASPTFRRSTGSLRRLTAEGPIAFKLDAKLAPDSALRDFTGRFTIGAGRVRINNPDAAPFFIDEASGAMAWDEDARRFRVDRFQILAGLTHVEAQGWIAPPADAARAWPAHLESHGAQFSPERPGANPVGLEFDGLRRPLPRNDVSVFRRRLTARGPTVDVAVKAETAPDGDGSSLKLAIDAGPSATADLIRLWPQFINPDVRQWCAENLHGGRLRGSMKANWTAADLDAMAHKRGLPRESLHGEFTTRDVSVDLMPGLPPMMTDEGSGSFTGHEFTVSGNRATMILSAVAARPGEQSRLHSSRHHPETDRRRFRAGAHDRNGRLARRSLDARTVAPPGGPHHRPRDRQRGGGRRSRPRSQAGKDGASRGYPSSTRPARSPISRSTSSSPTRSSSRRRPRSRPIAIR